MDRWSIIFLLVFMNCCEVFVAGQRGGSYTVVPKGVSQCDDDPERVNMVVYDNLKFKRLSRNDWVLSMYFLTNITIDDTIGVYMDISAKGNGGYKPHFMDFEFSGACSAAKMISKEWFKQLISKLNQTDCPVPPGRYELKEVKVGNTMKALSGMPTFPYGEYFSNNFLTRDGKKIACLKLLFSVNPKKKREKNP